MLVDGDDISRWALVTLALAGLAAGFIATVSFARSVAEPLDSVRDALARVRDGNLDVGLVVDDGAEIGEVQSGFNQMVDGLRERRALHDLFGRHVGRQVATQALERGSGLRGEQADASVVFVDLVGSTAMAEVLPPDEVVETLNDFFDVVVRAVDGQGGWVNKFEGDGALCIFGVPGAQPDHAARALRAARLLTLAVGGLADRHPGLAAGIGVSSGQVVAGNVGTEARYEYTVIGPAVNEAARLTEVAKGRAVKVLASGEAVHRAGGEADRWRDVGTVALRGRQAPTVIFAPTADTTVATPAEAPA
jgi:adenylate cyclase